MANHLDRSFRPLYEDQLLFVLNKPALIHSVMQQNSREQSLAEMLLESHPWLGDVAIKSGDAGLIHRLDYQTSGLIIGTKSRDIWLKMRDRLKCGSISKSYLALLDGALDRPLELQGYIGSPYRRASKVRVYPKPVRDARLLPAHTILKPIRELQALNATLVEASAPTARRHQIRAHSSSAGFPLLGDSKYGSLRKLSELLSQRSMVTPQIELPEFILHANHLRFEHPETLEIVTVISELLYQLP